MAQGGKSGYEEGKSVSQSLGGEREPECCLGAAGLHICLCLRLQGNSRQTLRPAISAFGSAGLHWGPWTGMSAGARICCSGFETGSKAEDFICRHSEITFTPHLDLQRD